MKLIFLFKKVVSMYSYLLWTPINRLCFLCNGVKVGKKLKCRGKVYMIFHGVCGELKLGNSVFINSGGVQNPIGCGDRTYFQIFENGKITIGDNTGISNTAFSCYEKITIEEHVMIGAGCKFFDNDFHPLDYDKRIYTKDLPNALPIYVKKGAFIGAGCYILKGVTIGEHSIIGAGSVVTKSVPDREIWAGNPAKYIGKTT